MSVRVLLVEDVDELRATLRQALRLHGDFDVVADVADGASAVAAAADHQPDVVVLDLGMPDLAGSELVARTRAAAPSARIVVYTGLDTDEVSAIGNAVDAFVRKDRDVRYLVGLLADLGQRPSRAAQIDLGPGVEDVSVARHFLDDNCRRWGCGEEAAGDAQLVVSELVTNAL